MKRPRTSQKSTAKPAAKPSAKQVQLDAHREDPAGQFLTTDQGVRVASTDDSLKAGPRGPTLLEDFHLREKIMRFDHERIPERVVHARGAGAHGYFQVYKPLSALTSAGFLNDPARRTPVFVRFSTVAGSRGSADVVRDVRGFAVKFYTEEGNFDLVGNNMPVFFIQDGIKFPDLIHAVKPHPHKEIPQAATAHDSFWDFISLTPEAAHMIMWVMSDRALPRSYRMMEGFGVHTYRLVDAAGTSSLVKWHWKPLLGTHSLVWEEAQQVNGKDPDFHRRDLWEAIEGGTPVEFELGLQVVAEEDAQAFGFDLIDPTKLLPEELVPVQRVGKMVLDRNPQNYFAEVEQVAFCVGNVVPGIDFSNDPLLQARLFSYLDTQLTRLGGPNFAELPINRPIAPVHNNQHDGFSRQSIPTGAANYSPNSLGDNAPTPAPPKQGGYQHYQERLMGAVNRDRSESFKDHFSQARLFLNSMTPVERGHIIDALSFELSHCERMAVRERVVAEILAPIDADLAKRVAAAIGVAVPAGVKAPAKRTGRKGEALAAAPSLSMLSKPVAVLATRRIAILAAPGCVGAGVAALAAALAKEGATVDTVSLALGPVPSSQGPSPVATKSLLSTASVLYDAVAIGDGADHAATLSANPAALQFVREAFGHCKAIAALGAGASLLAAAGIATDPAPAGVIVATSVAAIIPRFLAALGAHRHWEREMVRSQPPGAPTR